MATKTLKTSKHKIAPKKVAKKVAPSVILVGTYKDRQLAFIEREGVYNYPIGADDKLKPEDAAQVKELWLYAGRTKTARQVFEATFVGIQTREEFLAAHPTYPKSKSVHARYLVFKVKKLDYGTRLDDQLVFARAADFTTGKSAKIAAAIKTYEADGDYARIADYLPEELAAVPKPQLRVCVAAVQLDFMCVLDVSKTAQILQRVSSSPPDATSGDARLACLDFFAGSGLVSAGLSRDFRTVWANDISAKKALVFNANNKTGVLQVCPIENVAGKMLPSVDMSWGSFPCQDLSLAGDIKGLYASRSGLFWQWLRVMDEMKVKPPVVVAENVVGLVSASGGRYYVAVHNELVKRGYRVGAVMIDAAHWLPQSRKRIFVVGVRRGVDVSAFSSESPSWCHPEPVIRVSKLVEDWVWWKIPAPKVSQTTLDDIVDFKSPCDTEEECSRKIALISPEKVHVLRELSRDSCRAFAGYRRTRNHRQVLEVRIDGVAGCLRTPGGGSSRQILIIAENGTLRTRLLTVRETARLMGAPDSYLIPGSYNDGYMAMGVAVAVPVVQYLSHNLLAPLAMQSK